MAVVVGKFCNDDCIDGTDVCRWRCESARELRDKGARAIIEMFHRELGMQWCDNSRKVVDSTAEVLEEALDAVIEEFVANGRME